MFSSVIYFEDVYRPAFQCFCHLDFKAGVSPRYDHSVYHTPLQQNGIAENQNGVSEVNLHEYLYFITICLSLIY